MWPLWKSTFYDCVLVFLNGVMYYWLFSFDLNIVLKKFKAKEQDHIRLGYIIGIVSLFGIRGSKRGFKTRVRKKKRDDWNLIPFVTKGRNFQRAVSLTMLFFYHLLSVMGSTQFVLFLRFKHFEQTEENCKFILLFYHNWLNIMETEVTDRFVLWVFFYFFYF